MLSTSDDLGARAARKVDAASGRDRDFQPEEIHRGDHRRLHRGNHVEQARARRREQAANADAEEAREQDEVREIGEQPDVRRHPANQRNLEKQDQERCEKGARRAHAVVRHAGGVRPSFFRTSSGQPFHSATPMLPRYCKSAMPILRRPESACREVTEAREEADAVRQLARTPSSATRCVEQRRLLGGGAGDERLVVAVQALAIDPGKPAAHGGLPGRLIDHHEVHELRHAGVGRAAGPLVLRDDEVDEQPHGRILVRGEELRLERVRGPLRRRARRLRVLMRCCASASVHANPAATGAAEISLSNVRRSMSFM